MKNLNTYQASDNKCTLTIVAFNINHAKRILKAENCDKGMKIKLFEKNTHEAGQYGSEQGFIA